ncbi:MAG: McrC family protein [Bacteroidales bacterium]|nr:McrC family protein [Bacteroidales bacterium]MCF8338387.1 McrC family protein [Bacteroidales bacterium]
MHFRTTDNNRTKRLQELVFENEQLDESLNSQSIADLQQIGNHNISDLCQKNPNLLVIPPELGEHGDNIGKQSIFTYSIDGEEFKLTTHNIMGFIGKNNTELTISSRFYPSGNDYFLHYMLMRVFALNVFDLPTSPEDESIYDFLMYLFPYYLNKALAQGLYKEYKVKRYNDDKVKGQIDVTRHIKENIPFHGKIAYNTREQEYDNRINQLIRHTIEYIKTHPFGYQLFENPDLRKAVKTIKYITPSYSRKMRRNIMMRNRKPVSHPYFTAYEPLRKICLQILRKEGLSYGYEEDKIYGVLFDGAWLWEEYLNTILKEHNFKHPKNIRGEEGKKLFAETNRQNRIIYPDFYIEEKSILIDAKYKRIPSGNEIDREDLYQVITYMYRLKAKRGILAYPVEGNSRNDNNSLMKISYKMHKDSYGGKEAIFEKLGMTIPRVDKGEFTDFIKRIEDYESKFVDYVNKQKVLQGAS